MGITLRVRMRVKELFFNASANGGPVSIAGQKERGWGSKFQNESPPRVLYNYHIYETRVDNGRHFETIQIMK